MNLIVTVPKEINTEDKNTLELTVKNLNDQFAAIKGQINLYFLKSFQIKSSQESGPFLN
jgi:hypothetical protein